MNVQIYEFGKWNLAKAVDLNRLYILSIFQMFFITISQSNTRDLCIHEYHDPRLGRDWKLIQLDKDRLDEDQTRRSGKVYQNK